MINAFMLNRDTVFLKCIVFFSPTSSSLKLLTLYWVRNLESSQNFREKCHLNIFKQKEDFKITWENVFILKCCCKGFLHVPEWTRGRQTTSFSAELCPFTPCFPPHPEASEAQTSQPLGEGPFPDPAPHCWLELEVRWHKLRILPNLDLPNLALNILVNLQ